MCGRVAIFSYCQLGGDLEGVAKERISPNLSQKRRTAGPFSLLDLAGALVAEQALDRVHAFTDNAVGLVQRSRGSRA